MISIILFLIFVANLKNYFDMKKDIIKIVIKVLIYALGLIGAYFGVSSMSSCTMSRNMSHSGTGYFQLYDTVHVHGNSNFVYPKSK